MLETDVAASQRLLRLFYQAFVVAVATLLVLGTAFIFERKLVSSILCVLVGLLLWHFWRLNQRGKPVASLIWFASLMLVILVGLLYAGQPPMGVVVIFAFALTLAVVVDTRWAMGYGSTYLLAWAVYLFLKAHGMAPTPYFSGATYTGLIMATVAMWLVLLPVPELVGHLRRGKSLRTAVIEATQDGILVTDLNGNIQVYNQRLLQVWGLDRIQLTNAHGLLRYFRQQLPLAQVSSQTLRQRLALPHAPSVDVVTLRNGRVLECGSQPQLMDGSLVGRVWSFRDITTARQKDVAVREAVARFDAIARRVPGVIFELRRSPQGRLSLPFVSRAATETFWLLPQDLMQRPRLILPRIVPADRGRMLRTLLSAMDEQTPLHMDLGLRLPNGQARWVSISAEASQDDSGATLLHGVVIDTTERSLAQQELVQHRNHLHDMVQEQTAELRRTVDQLRLAEAQANAASRAKSAFLANMSHEIRTPMNGVLGMADILLATPLSANQQKLVQIMRESSTSLLNILNDILDLSKIEAGKLEVEAIATCLRDVVSGVVQVMQSVCMTRNIVLSVSVSPELPAWILSDPTRLRQVLFNLLGNAAKFTADPALRRPQVGLRLAPCQRSDGSPGLEIVVSDNGIGMSTQVQQNLFQEFSQADASTARRYGGTGLGLSISRQLVHMLGGSIRVASQLGVGTEFHIELPLHAAPQCATAAPDPAKDTAVSASVQAPPGVAVCAVTAQDDRPWSILLAEDNETNRIVMREQLSLLGYRADEAPDGATALHMWRRGHYALLLTDCHMPHMDGFELTRAIRQEEVGTAHVPIIAVTANAMEGEAQRCLDTGMDDYLTKPLRLSALQSMLAKWLPGDSSGQWQTTHPATAADTVPEPARADVWDRTALSQLLGDNPALQRKTLTSFLRTSSECVQRLADCATTDDLSQAGAQAHKLKSGARTVGAMALAQSCQTLEDAALEPNQHSTNWKPLVRDLLLHHTQACAAIQQALAN